MEVVILTFGEIHTAGVEIAARFAGLREYFVEAEPILQQRRRSHPVAGARSDVPGQGSDPVGVFLRLADIHCVGSKCDDDHVGAVFVEEAPELSRGDPRFGSRAYPVDGRVSRAGGSQILAKA